MKLLLAVKDVVELLLLLLLMPTMKRNPKVAASASAKGVATGVVKKISKISKRERERERGRGWSPQQ